MADIRLKSLRPFFPMSPIWDDEEWNILPTRSHELDVYETEHEIVIKAPVPGIPADKVDVTFEDGVLRISGRIEEKEEDTNKKKVVYSEYKVRSFDYTTTLPRAIDPGKIDAEVEHGIVTVIAPLAESSKPKKIMVKAKGK